MQRYFLRGMPTLVCALLVLGLASDVAAQQFTGGVRGAVRDANGVIPGVEVALVNTDTEAARSTFTNEVGEYNFTAVTPGNYTLRAVLQGFQTYIRSGLSVATQQFITIDVLMEVGTIQEQIQVTAAAPLIETSNASGGGNLDREILEALPAPGRNAYLVAVTIPTVMPVGDPQYNRQQDQTNASRISLGGGGVRANNYLLDGVPVTEMDGRAVLNTTIEALGDVKVQIHTYDAEMGRTGGGVFNATGRSGTNVFHGSAFYQTRPVWGESLPFFADQRGESKETSGVSEKYYRLFGYGVGGPIWKNRTFFWTASEGYRSRTTRELSRTYPTANQRVGNFSGTTENGSPIQIWNPWCRSGVASAQCPATGPSGTLANPEFANAIIPDFALDPIAQTMLNGYPLPRAQNEDTNANQSIVGNLVDTADMWTVKAEHKFTDNWSLSGLYVYNKTDEPGTADPSLTDSQHQEMDGGIWALARRPHVLVFNNTNILNDTTVLTTRYGWTTWWDSGDRATPSRGLADLGFSSNYVNQVHADGRGIFPDLDFDNFYGWDRADDGQDRRWNGPAAFNASLSKLVGSHTIKMGGDFRQLGVTNEAFANNGALSGNFNFDADPTRGPGGVGGYDFASFLVGVPSEGTTSIGPGPIEVYLKYYGGFVQDDWRVNSNMTLNFGIRFEHEDGLREVNNGITQRFDTGARSPINDQIVVNPAHPAFGQTIESAFGRQLTGGLVYAGIGGANEFQGDPPAVKFSPRFGMTYSLNQETVIRGGYGLFWEPWQYGSRRFGQEGFARTTSMVQPSIEKAAPSASLGDPYPGGLITATGSSLGLLQGLGGAISPIDPNFTAGYVQQYSIDMQRELPGNMAITLGYVGATGRDVGYGGTGEEQINLNQINPAGLPLTNGAWDASGLRSTAPNPFFGIPQAGEFASASTLSVGQLSRPFPQFANVDQFRSNKGGERQYNAFVIKLDKRTTGGFGGRFSYTFSRTSDNTWGEASTFTGTASTPQNYYDIAAEYARAVVDSPHRIILAPIIRFPEPADDGGIKSMILGGWTASAIVELVSGSAATAYNSSRSSANLGLLGGLQRPNFSGSPVSTSGSDTDRVASAGQLDARFFNQAAFADPGAGVYGGVPRNIVGDRYQFRKNIDFVMAKAVQTGGGSNVQFRFEILNLTNTPKFSTAGTNINVSGYGRISDQRGFSRIWQITTRFSF